jgi:capsular polysaccharide biosynthesis protein
MDLFTILGTIWRHKLVTIPIIMLTVLGLFYVLKVKPPTYQSTGSILLVNPPGPPTTQQIAANPSLGKISTANPYVSYGNLNFVADVVINIVDSPSVQQSLVQAGADPRYAVALAVALGNPPIIQVTGVASNGPEAIRTAQLVVSAVQQHLVQIQQNQNVNSHYMITGQEFAKPEIATKSVSGKLRTAISILALGLIVLLVAVSIMEALAKRRRGRGRGRKSRRSAANEHDDYLAVNADYPESDPDEYPGPDPNGYPQPAGGRTAPPARRNEPPRYYDGPTRGGNISQDAGGWR